MPVDRQRDSLGGVLAVWLALTASALWFVSRFSADLPSWDTWDTIDDESSGSMRWRWVFDQRGLAYHPLARLLGMLLLGVSGHDYRILLVFDVTAMSALALGTILLVRRARGWTDWRDGFVPLLLLHLGHHTALLDNYVYMHVLSTLVAGGWFMLAAWNAGPPGPARTAAWCACTAILPMSGHMAVAICPALVGWTGWRAAGLRKQASAASRRAGTALWCACVVAALELAWFAVRLAGGGQVLPGRDAGWGSVATTLENAAHFLTTALGPTATGAAWTAPATVLVLAWAAFRSARAASAGPASPGWAGPGLAVLGGVSLAALAVGVFRGSMGEGVGMANRYSLPSSLAWLAAYIVFTCGIADFPGRRMATIFWAVVLALWPINARTGVNCGVIERGRWTKIHRGVLDRLAPTAIASMVWPDMFPSEERLGRYFTLMATNRIGPWRNAPPPRSHDSVPEYRRGEERLGWAVAAGRVRGIAWSPDGRRLAACDERGFISIHDSRTGHRISRWSASRGVVSSLALLATNRVLAGSWDDGLTEWELPGPRLVRQLTARSVVSLGVCRRTGRIAWGESSSDATVRWVGTGNTPASLPYHLADVPAVDWDPSGRFLATGGGEGILAVWEPVDGRLCSASQVHSQAVLAVKWSPDGRSLASGGWDGRLRLIPWRDGYPEMPGDLDAGHGWIGAVAWSRDGRMLAAAGEDGAIRLYRPGESGAVALLRGHRDAVTGLAFGPGGDLLASGSWDGSIRIWNVPH